MAHTGDRIHVHSHAVDVPDRIAEILEVRGEDGGPPYLVRYDDGHQTVIYPGPDTTVETADNP